MLEILFQDDDVVAVNKPSGIKVHHGGYDARREPFELKMVRDQVRPYLYTVHRLDKPTSGVMIFALNPGAAPSLTKSFARHQVHKTYLAVVRGYIAETGRVDHPLRHLIINDRQYGDNKHNRFFSEELNCRRLLLAATELWSPHPRSRETTCLTARLDEDFSQIMTHMGWDDCDSKCLEGG